MQELHLHTSWDCKRWKILLLNERVKNELSLIWPCHGMQMNTIGHNFVLIATIHYILHIFIHVVKLIYSSLGPKDYLFLTYL